MRGSLVLAALLASGVARADPAARLSVARAEDARACPDDRALADRVAAVAGRPLVEAPGSPAARVAIAVRIVRAPSGGYAATVIASGDRNGTREIEDASVGCDALADAVAVSIAILVDPTIAPPPPRSTTVLHPVDRVEPPPRAKEGAAREPLTVSVAALGGASFGVLDGAAFRFSAGVGVEEALPRFGAWAAFSTDRPDDAKLQGGTVRVRSLGADLRACGRALGDRHGPRLWGCGGMSLFDLRGEGRGYLHDDAGRRLLVEAVAGARVWLPIAGRLGAVASAELGVPLDRTEFRVVGVGTAAHTGLVTGALALGLGASIW